MTANPKWPRPGEPDVERARAIALMYRQHLRAWSVDLCDQADQTAVAFGEYWAAPHLVHYEPEDAITTSQAAELVGVSPDMIRHWARLTHPDDPSRPLLPRARRQGREMTYRVMHVEAASEAYRRSQHARAASRSTRSA